MTSSVRFAPSVTFSLVLALASLGSIGVNGQGCLNEDGKPVDWWMVIKVPRIKTSSYDVVKNGSAYLYADPSTLSNPSRFFVNSSIGIDDVRSAPGRTIQQVYDNVRTQSSEQGYVFYNDETPAGDVSMSYGHTKGHVAWTTKVGFWLIHSVPKYADSPERTLHYSYPSSGQLYGQTMFCMSIGLDALDEVFAQLQYTNPQVYAKAWIDSLNSKLPNGNAFVKQGIVVKTASSRVGAFKTIGGLPIHHFAKTVKWGQSIYGELIGPYYGSDMLCETWQRPYQEPLRPPTSAVSVYSVLDIGVPSNSGWDGVGWHVTSDHSKWSVTIDPAMQVVCIGDINKQKSQWQRSGGLACVSNPTIWKTFNNLVVNSDQGTTMVAMPSTINNDSNNATVAQPPIEKVALW